MRVCFSRAGSASLIRPSSENVLAYSNFGTYALSAGAAVGTNVVGTNVLLQDMCSPYGHTGRVGNTYANYARMDVEMGLVRHLSLLCMHTCTVGCIHAHRWACAWGSWHNLRNA